MTTDGQGANLAASTTNATGQPLPRTFRVYGCEADGTAVGKIRDFGSVVGKDWWSRIPKD